LFNEVPGQSIMHCHRLRQGDSLSPMLFILVMVTLNPHITKVA
jgi:hypothetical protein